MGEKSKTCLKRLFFLFYKVSAGICCWTTFVDYPRETSQMDNVNLNYKLIQKQKKRYLQNKR